MSMHYTPRLGGADGAHRVHIHETLLTVATEADRVSHYEHEHAAEEAVYLLEGRAVYTFADHRVEAGPGDLVFFPAGVRHGHTEVLTDHLRYLVIRSVEPGDSPCCCAAARPAE